VSFLSSLTKRDKGTVEVFPFDLFSACFSSLAVLFTLAAQCFELRIGCLPIGVDHSLISTWQDALEINRNHYIFYCGAAFMSKSKLVTVFLVLFIAINLFAAATFGGILGYGTPYTDVGGHTWTGTGYFENTDSGLQGYVDYIVYGPGQFPYADSGYNPPSDLYTYVYQIRNTGSVAISDFQFSVNQTVNNLDSFVSPGRVEGVLASGTDFVSGEGGWVDWVFSGINGIETLSATHDSAGLVFTSPKAPEVTSTGMITDGGTSGFVDSLPCPGPNDIPEPGTLILLSAGLGCLAIGRRFFRR
jgi:hypothetical protein